MEKYTGDVFNVGRSTQNMSVDSFMKHMDAGSKEVSFEEIEAPTKTLEMGTDASEAYFNQLQQVNDFGMAMAERGIDVTNPKRNNPDALKASRFFQTQMGKVKQQAAGLVAGHEYAKLMQAERLKNGRGGPGVQQPGADGFVDATTAKDLNQLYNWGAQYNAVQKGVKNINSIHAKEYDDPVSRDIANAQIEEYSRALDGQLASMIEGGVPEGVAQGMIEELRGGLGKATLNQLNIDNQAEKKRKNLEDEKRKERVAKSQIVKNRAAAKKSKGGGYDSLVKKVIALKEGRSFDDSTKITEDGSEYSSNVMIDDELLGYKLPDGQYTGNVIHRDGDAYIEVYPDAESIADEEVVPELRRLDNGVIREVLGVSEYKKFETSAKEDGVLDENGELIHKKTEPPKAAAAKKTRWKDRN